MPNITMLLLRIGSSKQMMVQWLGLNQKLGSSRLMLMQPHLPVVTSGMLGG
ncbi:conserved hypothetical protein [Ricinus communis]|uniref:Uncharacterized protein n=1 Tax=Ricinus communis TaxID=3988 RepID=B9SH58_RICCO|nr:conserved hypothetical protein [Ricinus communis]